MAQTLLEPHQREAFYENGSVLMISAGQAVIVRYSSSLLCVDRYLVLPGFFNQDAVEAMLNRAKQLIDEVDLETHPMVSTTPSRSQAAISFAPSLADSFYHR